MEKIYAYFDKIHICPLCKGETAINRFIYKEGRLVGEVLFNCACKDGFLGLNVPEDQMKHCNNIEEVRLWALKLRKNHDAS